jgi:hypothetical protein
MATCQTTSGVCVCHHCGANFSGRKRKYCSKRCALLAARKRNLSRRSHQVPHNNHVAIENGEMVFCCLQCGNHFTGARRKYCSTECAHQSKQEKAKARDPQARQQERARMAAKKGKRYAPGGVAARSLPLQVWQSRLAKQNAKQAWDWWMQNAPDEWMAAYYAATGKPWRNPRLSSAGRYRLRYAIDAEFNLKEKLRLQIKKAKRTKIQDYMRSALCRNGNSLKVEQELGYTIHDLRIHLEKQFTKGMNWDRFKAGDIHIDHILPQSSFNLEHASEWSKCWCLSNLRPMWARENIQKGDRVLFLL